MSDMDKLQVALRIIAVGFEREHEDYLCRTLHDAADAIVSKQRNIDAARARIKELEAVVTNEAESHEELRSLDPLFYAYHDNRAAILRAALSAKGGSDE